MNFGFDAKRIYHNRRGLGNYSRDTLRILSEQFPENTYLLFNPKSRNNIPFPFQQNTTEILPEGLLWKTIPSLWRSLGIAEQIKKEKIDIFHGLSQELPLNIQKTGAKSVVTVHDAIFIRYPELYSSAYRYIFMKKNEYACKVADKIIAVSEQTKRDFIEFFGVDEQKITVVYQGCNHIFKQPVDELRKETVRKKYGLPQHFLLNVGAIEKRKNTALIVEAMYRKNISLPLVIIGNSTDYKQAVIETATKYNLLSQLIFLHNMPTEDLPAMYSLADIFVYPSIFEGFGIPVLEALSVGTPVISSRGSCFEETGGTSSVYINPYDAEELGEAIHTVLSDTELRRKMITEGRFYAENFTDEKIARKLMQAYASIL